MFVGGWCCCVVVRRSSFVVRRSSFVVRRSSFVVRRSSFVVLVRNATPTQLTHSLKSLTSPTHSQSVTHSLTHSATHSLNRRVAPFTHSPTHSLIHCQPPLFTHRLTQSFSRGQRESQSQVATIASPTNSKLRSFDVSWMLDDTVKYCKSSSRLLCVFAD